MKILSFFTDTQYTFEGKHPYEDVIVMLRRHWFVLVIKVIGFLILALLPLAIYLLMVNFDVYQYALGFYGMLVIIYFLFWWYQLFYSITMYLLDVWIITNHRVIDSEQHGFFNRTVAELNLSKIQDIETKVGSFIGTLLKFGDLDIQTAGTSPKFSFKQIPNPLLVKDQLMRVHNEYIAKHPGGVEIHEQQGL